MERKAQIWVVKPSTELDQEIIYILYISNYLYIDSTSKYIKLHLTLIWMSVSVLTNWTIVTFCSVWTNTYMSITGHISCTRHLLFINEWTWVNCAGICINIKREHHKVNIDSFLYLTSSGVFNHMIYFCLVFPHNLSRVNNHSHFVQIRQILVHIVRVFIKVETEIYRVQTTLQYYSIVIEIFYSF